jgi:2-oxoglutarate ferredoxin oxidoreductase subunit delta
MAKIEIDEVRCKGCGLCTVACPFKLILISEQVNLQGFTTVTFVNPERCSGCALCAEICPDVAISVFK